MRDLPHQPVLSLRILKEVRALLILAGPIIVAQLAHTAMGFVDAVMAGRVSANDLAAVALGNSIWVPVFLFISGILLATTSEVARRFGAGQQGEIGEVVRQGLWLGLAIGLMACALLWLSEPVLHWMQVDAALIAPTMGYLQAVALGLPAIALYLVLRCFSDGLGITRPSMVFGVLGLLLNIPANYVFIYGKFGLPAMGGVGCGWATALVMWLSALGLLLWVRWAPAYQASRLFSRFSWPEGNTLKHLLKVGTPIGVAIFAEASIFSVIALLIGGLGAIVVAGHQIALNVSSLIFMIPYSLGMASTVRVGQALGRNAPQQAEFAAWTSLAVALGYACLSVSLIMWLRTSIAGIYTNDAQVISLAASLLVFSAIFQFSDAIQVTAAGALRGYHDTRSTMLLTLFAYWCIGLPLGASLGLSDFFGSARGPAGLWMGLVAGLSVAAVLLAIRLRKIAQREIRRAS
ncbi:MATE family efflux transporter [Atopomonas sediminilitoris]|uniref:MATE family efflux transporter n=1 Tax=Atopomonas sediminilitoris TaxID=2919919 RepID=UPI001F4ED80E|nr:MATE family efflux transporter [Atopomonas sediminilitoris]MCJ8169168.1 MATE family efflux transporter [Atopomonas sediminilitoris]